MGFGFGFQVLAFRWRFFYSRPSRSVATKVGSIDVFSEGGHGCWVALGSLATRVQLVTSGGLGRP